MGGTSGLGPELAKLYKEEYEVIITGRTDPKENGLSFESLDIGADIYWFNYRLEEFLKRIKNINLLIYAAGFYQEGTMDRLSHSDLLAMNNIGLLAPALFLQKILKRQENLPGFIPITSTSQWTPVYWNRCTRPLKLGSVLWPIRFLWI